MQVPGPKSKVKSALVQCSEETARLTFIPHPPSAVLRAIEKRPPYRRLKARLHLGDFEGWAKAGLETSKKVVYPKSLKRNQAPPESYGKKAYKAAEPGIALAGYRLASILDKGLGG